MAIQGMSVGGEQELRDLPFSQCADEVDSLKMFTFHDPRMLINLVERRMVTDIGRYIADYTGSRLEPPSFLITVDELPYYANLPWGRYVRAIKSVPVWAAYSPYAERGYVQGEVDPSAWKSTSRVVRFDPPEMDDKLDERREGGSRLASNSVRGIEIVYQEQRTEILLSAESPTDSTRDWRNSSQSTGSWTSSRSRTRGRSSWWPSPRPSGFRGLGVKTGSPPSSTLNPPANMVTEEDVIWHTLMVGETGSGKSNGIEYWMLRLFDRRDVAIVFVDPAGDAALDLVRRITGRTGRGSRCSTRGR